MVGQGEKLEKCLGRERPLLMLRQPRCGKPFWSVRGKFCSLARSATIPGMPTNRILSVVVAIVLSISIQRALAEEAAEGGKPLINKDMSGWKLKDSNNKETWK